MKKCINKKVLSVLLAVMLTVSVFATCLVFSATAADDPDAIKIDYIGYHHEAGFVQIVAGDGKTVAELTGKDLNAHRVIVVDKDNVVVKTYHVISRDNAGGVKSDVVCPAGGYIIAIHDSLDAAKMVDDQNTSADTVHPGDKVELTGVNLDDVRAHNGLENCVNASGASFKVIPYNTDGVTINIVSVNQKVQGETNGIITKYADPAKDATTYGTAWTKLIRLKNVEGNKYKVVNDFWAFGNKVEALTEGEIFLTVACSGPNANAVIGETVTNIVGNYVAYGVKKGDIVEIAGDISTDGAKEGVTATFTRIPNLALNATVLNTPSYGTYTGKVNDGKIAKYSFNSDWAAFYKANTATANDNYDGKVGEIVIDFGAKQDFSSFRTHVWGTVSSAGIAEMEKVEFFVSDDNKTWTSVGAVTEGLTGEGVWVELEKAASGRYVKYAYTKSTAEDKGGVFLFISECEAYGKPTPVVIDVDTTGWTKVDGETAGTWQTALNPTDPNADKGDNVGSYVYKAGKVDGKYVIEVVFSGELSGTPESDKTFGNGYGTNVRVWFHSAKNEAGTEQLSYNTLLDVAYNGETVVSRLATNSELDKNKANWILGYDAEKPYTVESIIPTAKDGLYVKITFDEIPNIVDNNDVVAVISVSNKPEGKNNNCLHSNTYTDGNGPWHNDTWITANLGTTVSFAEPVDDPSSEPSSEDTSSEPSSEPTSEESSDASTASTASTASAGESSVDAPQTGDMGIAAIALLAIVTAGGVFAVRKFR